MHATVGSASRSSTCVVVEPSLARPCHLFPVSRLPVRHEHGSTPSVQAHRVALPLIAAHRCVPFHRLALLRVI